MSSVITLFLYFIVLGIAESESGKDSIFIASILCGSYFIFLGFYWMIVFWWSRATMGRSTTITFSFLTTLWIVLCLYFIGVTSSLITELYHHHCPFLFKVLQPHNNCSGNNTMFENIPFFSLSSMVILWLVYVAIFMLNVMYTCQHTPNRVIH